MRPAIGVAYKRELALAKTARREGNIDIAVAHVERAHVLGQRYLVPHLRTHWILFSIARERSNYREMAAQALRLLAVLPGYLTGWVPRGNTGSGNISAWRTMTPPSDLAPLLARGSIAWDVAVRVVVLGLAAVMVQAAPGVFDAL